MVASFHYWEISPVFHTLTSRLWEIADKFGVVNFQQLGRQEA